MRTMTNPALRHKYAATLFAKGYTRAQVIDSLTSKYNISSKTACSDIRYAYEIIQQQNDSFIKNLRNIQLTRLELLWQKALEDGNLKIALEVIKVTNTTFGLNSPDNLVAIQNNDIKFNFGGPINA